MLLKSNPFFRYIFLAIAALLTIAPSLFYAGHWDRYLSFNLYSGWQKRFYIRFSPEAANQLPPEISERFMDSGLLNQHKVLSVSGWAMDELNVPLISEWRILRRMAREFCQYNANGVDVFYLISYSNRKDLPRRYYNCSEIEKMRRNTYFEEVKSK